VEDSSSVLLQLNLYGKRVRLTRRNVNPAIGINRVVRSSERLDANEVLPRLGPELKVAHLGRKAESY